MIIHFIASPCEAELTGACCLGAGGCLDDATVSDCIVAPGEYLGDGSPDQRDYWVDFSKIARMVPQFTLKWNAREGVKELYSAYQQVGLQAPDLETGRKYVRLRQLRHLMDSGSINSELRWVRAD